MKGIRKSCREKRQVVIFCKHCIAIGYLGKQGNTAFLTRPRSPVYCFVFASKVASVYAFSCPVLFVDIDSSIIYIIILDLVSSSLTWFLCA